MRRAAKRDANEPEIVTALKGEGATVTQISQSGVLDLLVGYRKRFIVMEVKDEDGQLTPNQKKFMKLHEGCPMAVVRTTFDAINALRLLSS